MYNAQQLDVIQAIFLAVIAAACVVMFIYFIFFDNTDEHDVEIDNIYRQLADNSKMEDSINKDFNSYFDNQKTKNQSDETSI